MTELIAFIKKIQQERKIQTLSEEATKQSIILRILHFLNWQVFDAEEVCPEYSIEGTRVDYALRNKSSNKVFIEVKRIGEELDKHQEQLLTYSFRHGVKLAILTNGIVWWFYLPLHEGSWEERKFYTIDIYSQDPEDIASKLNSFLNKEEVISGTSVKNAENFYHNKQKGEIIKSTLIKAWKKLLNESDEILVELVAEATEKICGYKPDNKTVSEFLFSINTREQTLNTKEQPVIPDIPKIKSSNQQQISRTSFSDNLDGNYTYKNIQAFTFSGREYKVNSWKDFPIKISELIISENSQDYRKILQLKGRKRFYFSENKNILKRPHPLKNTSVYIETNLSANNIVNIS